MDRSQALQVSNKIMSLKNLIRNYSVIFVEK